MLCITALLSACSRTAEQAWTFSGDAPSRTGLLPVGDSVVLGNEAGALIRLGASGRPQWRLELLRELVATPTVVGDAVIAATTTGEWVGADLASGRERWRVGGRAVVTLPLASDGERAFAVAEDGAVQAISPGSGGTVWKRLPPKELKDRTGLTAPPIVLNGRLFVALGAAGLFALDPQFGETLWHRALGDVSGFLAEGERIYAVTRDGQLTALRAADGEVEWRHRLDVEVKGGPWLARGLLWLAVGERDLLAADPQNGHETWRVTLPAPTRGGVGEYREWLLVPTNGREGQLLVFRIGQSEPVMTLRADSALRTAPLVRGDQARVLASDGRVIAWELSRTP